MKTKIKILIISILAILMLIIGLIFAINHKKESIKYFNYSGYIINNVYDQNDTSNVDRAYFEANSSYIPHSNNEYAFTNSDGNKEIVGEDSFVHYKNGSIMALKDGVAIDLNDIDSNLLSYYNVFEGSIISKSSIGYDLKNTNQNISLQKLMFKISDKKYLIGADNIVISFSDNQTIDMKDYAEIEYVNKDVIRIYNDQVNYQTIASNLFLIIDDIKIDLEYKDISKKNVKYLTMADMVINANDNIEILPVKQNIESPTDDNSNNNENQNTDDSNNIANQNGENSINSDLTDTLNNIVNNTNQTNEQVDTTDNYIQPKFSVESMDVTPLGFKNLKMSFIDESNVLYGNRTVEIIENSTGKVINNFDDWEEGNTNYSINSYFSLKSNTEYTLNVKGQYKIDNTIYDRTFVSKIFRTLDIGIDIIQDFITSNSISFTVYRNDYSNITGFSYRILDSDGNEIVGKTKTNYLNEDDNKLIVKIDRLKSNTEYTIEITGITYGNLTFSTISYENLKVLYTLKTLKSKPYTNVELTNKINDNKNTLTLGIEGINDTNNGIKSYTYKVYKLLSNSTIYQIVHTSRMNSYKDLTLDIESIGQGGQFIFNVEIEFDDNEKTIVYTTNNSGLINTSSTKYPQVVGYETIENINCETLNGIIKISDPANFIDTNYITNYKIVLKEKANSTSSTQQYENSSIIKMIGTAEEIINLPISFEGLKPNTDYILYVYLKTLDGYTYIGYQQTKTKEPDSIYLTFTNIDKESEEAKSNLFGYTAEVDKNIGSTSLENLKFINFELYYCSGTNVCTKIQFPRTIPKNQDNEQELMDLKEGLKLSILSNSFGFVAKDYIQANHYKIVTTAIANDGYSIPVKINYSDTNSTNEFVLDIFDTPPIISLKLNEVQNAECSSSSKCNGMDKNDDYDDETVVGIELEASIAKSTMGVGVNNFHYLITQTTTNECSIDDIDENATYESVMIGDGITEHKEFVKMGDKNLSRGNAFCVYYYGDYPANIDGRPTGKVSTKKQALSEQPFFIKKQKAKISGYISKYETIKNDDEGNATITFNLNISDIDHSIDLIYLSNSGERIEPEKGNEDQHVYRFKFQKGINYGLYDLETGMKNKYTDEDPMCSDENQKCIENKLYTLNLNDIYEIGNSNLIVDTTSAGKLIFKLPYNECPTDEGEDSSNVCITNNISEHYKIAGLLFQNNEKIKRLDLINNGTDAYTVEINYSDFEKFGLSIDNDGNISIPENTISLIYDDGSIDDSNQFFLKRYMVDTEEYYNLEIQKFSNISTNGIFNRASVDSLLTESKYISGDESNSSIGYLLGNKLVEFNKAKTTTITTYGIEDDKPKTLFKSNQILSTTKLNTIYTSTGAEASFKVTSRIIQGTKLMIDLYDSNNNSISSIETIASCDESSCTWNESESDKLKLNYDSDTIKISFKNLTSYTDTEIKKYKYTIRYLESEKNPDSPKFSYNDFTKQNNVDIPITSLVELNSSSLSVSYLKEYWNFHPETPEKISFLKLFNFYFNVDTSNYKLLTEENMIYKISLEQGETKVFINHDVDGKSSEIFKLESVNSEIINIYNFIKEQNLNGYYDVYVNPIIKKSDDEIALTRIKLNKAFIDNDNPTFTINNSGDTDFKLSLKDESGTLEPCGDRLNRPQGSYSTASSLNSYASLSSSDGENFYYFELIKDGVVIGYSKIPFVNISAWFKLNDFFKDKKLVSGEYTSKVSYCTAGKESVTEISKTFYVKYTNLNISIQPFPDLYMLKMENPDINVAEAITKIDYQYSLNGTYVQKRLDNLDINDKNDFSIVTFENAPDTYYLILNVDGNPTSSISDLTIYFYTADSDMPIATY